MATNHILNSGDHVWEWNGKALTLPTYRLTMTQNQSYAKSAWLSYPSDPSNTFSSNSAALGTYKLNFTPATSTAYQFSGWSSNISGTFTGDTITLPVDYTGSTITVRPTGWKLVQKKFIITAQLARPELADIEFSLKDNDVSGVCLFTDWQQELVAVSWSGDGVEQFFTTGTAFSGKSSRYVCQYGTTTQDTPVETGYHVMTSDKIISMPNKRAGSVRLTVTPAPYTGLIFEEHKSSMGMAGDYFAKSTIPSTVKTARSSYTTAVYGYSYDGPEVFPYNQFTASAYKGSMVTIQPSNSKTLTETGSYDKLYTTYAHVNQSMSLGECSAYAPAATQVIVSGYYFT